MSADECFIKDNSTFLVEQLSEPYLTHITGRKLDSGTVCTFNVTTYNGFDRQLDTVSASCAVNGIC